MGISNLVFGGGESKTGDWYAEAQRKTLLAFDLLIPASLIWLPGLILGIGALRATRTLGRRGVYGSALVGTMFDAILLGLAATIMVFVVIGWHGDNKRHEQQVAELAVAQKNHDALLAVYDAYMEKIQAPGPNYEAAAAKLANPLIFTMDQVVIREDLKTKEDLVRQFISASEAMRNQLTNAPSFYEHELALHGLTPEQQVSALNDFRKSLARHSDFYALALSFRESDVRRGRLILEVITSLDDNWGKWRSVNGKLLFDDTNALGEFRSKMKDYNDSLAEGKELQQAMLEFKRTNR